VVAQRDATLVAEIVSPGTEGDDRGDKFHQYQQLPSLREYLLLSTEAVHADLFRRGAEGLWVLHQFGPGDDLTLESIDFRVPMAQLYRGVEVEGSARA
jgi:Uma2 family endonuclease